jgi:DNA polymerase
MSSILDDISAFLKYQKEVFGEQIFTESTVSNRPIELSQAAPIVKDVELPRKKVVEAPPQIPETPQIVEATVPAIIEKPKVAITPPPVKSIEENWQESQNMDELRQRICNCKECPLGHTRIKFVFGSGNPNADILVIGEGPGADEDAQGLPFVGRSGQLLTKILESIQLSRDEVFIANIVKCRPPNNRRPESGEVDKCEPYLKKQIELIKPQFILALGLTAVDTLFKAKHRMGDIRGKLMTYHGIKTLPTFHPAALLRNPNFKRDTWEDVKLLRRLYDEYLASKTNNIS